MKKAVLILLVAVLALAPAMADSYSGSSEDGSFGIGVNLGTSSGVGMKFGFGDFDLIANVGFDAFHLGDGVGIGGEIGLGYQVYDIKIDRQNHMPVTVGLLMPLGFYFGDNSSFWLGAAIYGGLEYQFPEVPILLYLRLGLGADFTIPAGAIDFLFAGGIGALWMF